MDKTYSRVIFLTLTIICVLLPFAAEASELYIPALQTSKDADLGLALVNPTLSTAQVTLTARSYAGAIIAGSQIVNPVTLALPASTQKALGITEIFGPGISGQSGWVEISTSTSAVKGLFLFYNSSLTYIDGGELQTTPSSRVIFPNVSTDTSSQTRLSLVNTDAQDMQGTVSLYENSGRLAGSWNITLAGMSGFSGVVNELVPAETGFQGYVVVDSTTNSGSEIPSLIGIETYQDRADIALIRAFPESARLRTGFLPHSISRGAYRTKLMLVNFSSESQVLRIAALGLETNGAARNPSSVVVERTLAPYARLEENADDMFNFSGDALITGYIRFDTLGDTSGVIGFLDYGTTDGIVLSAVEAQAEGYSNLFFSHLAEGAGFYTGLALLNTNNEPSIVTMDTFDASGSRTNSSIVNLQPGERKAQVLSEFLQAQVNQLGGYIRLTATRPVFALELFGSRNSSTFLASVPAQGEALKPQISGRDVDASLGANVISDDGSASLLVPPMALDSNTAIKIKRINLADLPKPAPNQEPVLAVEATPAGTQFQIPVRLTFPLNASLDPGTQLPLLIFDPPTRTYQKTEFTAIVDNSGRTASAEVTHFTQYVSAFATSGVTITSITPSTMLSPGDTVIIAGGGYRNPLNVTFAGDSHTSVTAQVLSSTSTSIQAVVPAGAVTGDVIVKAWKNTSTGFPITVKTSANPAPGTISLSPSSTKIGTIPVTVQIAGTGFMTSSVVNYDGAPAPIPATFVDSTLLNVTLGPFSTAAIHHINVVNPAPGGGTSNTVDFTVTAGNAPVAAFTYSPSSPVTGSPVSFNGSSSTCNASPCSYNWTDDADSSVLGTGATMSFTFSGTGTKYVRLTITDALSQTANVEHDVIVSSTVVTSPPTITSFTPASGPTGTSVTISGTNFTGATAVLFNGVSASFTVSSATAIQATVPAGATTGSLKVTTPGGTATSTSSFTVTVSSSGPLPPVVTACCNQTITLPSSASLSGTASDPNGYSFTTTWSKFSGSGTATFVNANALSTTATFSGSGTYVLQLSATDTASLTGTATVTITVNPAPSSGTTFYVSTSGNDSNAGTSTTSSWRTIQKAANTLKAGQTAVVSAGTYNERVQIGTSGSSSSIITFQAQGTVVTQGFNVGASYNKIDGFEMVASGSGWSDRTNGSGVYLNGSNNQISNNYIHNSTAAGIYMTTSANNNTVNNNRIAAAVECGIFIQGSTNLIASNDISHSRDIGGSDADGIRFFGSGHTVRKNYIHDISLSDSPGASPHIDCYQTWGPATNYVFEQNTCDKSANGHQQGFTIEALTTPVQNITIRNNVFISRGTGYQPDVNAGDLGTVSNVTIMNNTMVAVNGAAEYAIWLFPSLNGAVVKGNAIYDHGNSGEPYIRVDSGASGLSIGNNSISKSNGTPPVGSPYPNDLWMVNPQFVNMAGMDFHLQSTSPLIDKSIVSSAVPNDKDDKVRPLGASDDIGAYEMK